MNFAKVNVSTAASHAIVAASAGKVIRVLGVQLIAAGDVTLTIEDSDGTDLFGPVALSANGGFVLPVVDANVAARKDYVYTAAGKGLNILLGGAVQVGGAIQYALL